MLRCQVGLCNILAHRDLRRMICGHVSRLQKSVFLCEMTRSGGQWAYTLPPSSLAWTVTTSDPRETMTTTLVNTERECVAGAYGCRVISQIYHEKIEECERTFTLSMIASMRQRSNGPQRSQSL